MENVKQFEDLQSWQKARQLANLIYNLTEHPKFTKDICLSGQIQDATGKVMHNIAKGFESTENSEVIRLLELSIQSISEVQSELYLALDRKYIYQTELDTAYDLAAETKNLIKGMIGCLQKTKPPIIKSLN